MAQSVVNQKIDEERFLRMHAEVLKEWPTGREVDLDEATEYQRNLSDAHNFMKVTLKLKEEGRTAVWPRAGTPVLDQEIALVKTLVASGIVHVPVTTDSHTRRYDYKKAQQGLDESIRTGKPHLNGYPIAIHGVKNTRKVVESVEAAFSPRGVGKLGMEISLASGMTAAGKSAFLEFGSYEKNRTLEDCFEHTQYTNRLAGYYTERGSIITTDLHGFVPSGVFPLSVNLACIIVDALTAAAQGVRSVMPHSHFLGNLVYDLAWLKVSHKLMREYLDRYGYQDVVIPGTLANQTPLFPVPLKLGAAFGYITYSAMTAALGNVEACFVRTIDEGSGIPTEEAHTLTYQAANWIFNVVRKQGVKYELKDLATEEKMIEMETRAIVDRILELGEGDPIIGSLRAVEAGVIDSPFCPNIHVKDQVLGIKDLEGACRYLEFGNLPLPPEVKDFHRAKVAARENKEGRKMDYDVVIEDFWAFSKGKIIGA